MNLLQLPGLSQAQKMLIVGLLAAIASFIYLSVNVSRLLADPPFHMDIATFYAAANTAFEGKSSPYTAGLLQQFRSDGIAIIYPFLYPPPALLLFWPMNGLDFHTVFTANIAINAMLIGGLIVGLSLWFLHVSGSLAGAIVFIPFLTEGSKGLWATLWYGQINGILAFLLIGVIWGLSTRRAALAGVTLGLSIIIKVYPALLIPYLVIRNEWKTLVWTVCTLVIMTSLAAILLPGFLWNEWYLRVLTHGYGNQPEGLMLVSDPSNLGIAGLIARTFDPRVYPVALFTYVAVGQFVIAGLISVWRRPDSYTKQFLAILWLTFIIAPISWLSHLTYLAIVPAYFMAEALRNRQFVWLVLFGALYAYALPYTQTTAALSQAEKDIPAIAAVIIWVMMQYQIWRKQKLDRGETTLTFEDRRWKRRRTGGALGSSQDFR